MKRILLTALLALTANAAGAQEVGHTQVQTTARYAHLAADPIKDAADQVAEHRGGV